MHLPVPTASLAVRVTLEVPTTLGVQVISRSSRRRQPGWQTRRAKPVGVLLAVIGGGVRVQARGQTARLIAARRVVRVRHLALEAAQSRFSNDLDAGVRQVSRDRRVGEGLT